MKLPVIPHIFFFFVATATLFLVAELAHAAEPAPNVVIIFADDLGYGDLGCYGATKLRTPHIDQLAKQGRRFRDAHSASAVCTPSRYALLTGDYPFRRGLTKPVFDRTGLVIDPERSTLADVMKNAGYATACIGKWHLGFGTQRPNWNGELKPGPLELGFDYYYGVPVVNSHPPFVYVENHHVVGRVPEDPIVYGKNANTKAYPEKMGTAKMGGGDAAHALYKDDAVGTTLLKKSVDWITANKGHPFFLLLSTTNIHHPFTPAPRFLGSSDCGLYGDFVHELDWMVGEVMATLKAQGVADNTLVIFTSDNGGMLNQTGQAAVKMGHRLNGELLGYKFDAWEGGHRVPFIAHWPGKIAPGTVSDQLVSNVDLLATLAALTKQPLKAQDGVDSFDILPALIGNPEQPIRDHLVLSPSKASHLALRERSWLYIGGKGGGGFSSPKPGAHAFGGPAAITFSGQENSDVVDGKFTPDAPSEQLYNLADDPSQTRNVVRTHPERAVAMKAKLQHIGKSDSTRPTATPSQKATDTARRFRTTQLEEKFHAEGAAVGDFNHDGNADLVYGPFWFEGPTFKVRHRIYEANPFPPAAYSDNFFPYTSDLDKDGNLDVLILGFPGRENSTYWYKNPGKDTLDAPWQKHAVFDGVGNESPVWADVTQDGHNEVLCSVNGQFGFVAPQDPTKPEQRWAFTAISPPNSTGGKFTHGLGFGDVNGDGRNDVLERTGWWEHPANYKPGMMWTKHPFTFSADKGGSQMFAYDFDADGDQDVVTALNAHGYGLAWFEQITENNTITFKRHLIMGHRPEESRYNLAFSQLHGLALEDVDGDGIRDIITGKRFFAHGGKDPGGRDTPVIYWFRTLRGESGTVDFVPYLIHDASGVGTDVTTGDVNNDGKLDIVIGNKRGCFLHIQTEEKADAPQPAAAKPQQALQRLEGESLEILKRTATVKTQVVKLPQGTWSGDAQLFWINGTVGDTLEVALPVAADGTYHVGAALTKAVDYAIFTFAIDGKQLGEPLDLYNNGVIHVGPLPLGDPIELTAGSHVLSVTITGIRPEAVKKQAFGLDYLVLSKEPIAELPAPKPAPPKARNPLKEGNAIDAKALLPSEQQAKFILPEGFVIDLIASEETGLAKPTSLAFDDAGRLWVTTATEYPRDRDANVWKNPGKDRIGIIDQPHSRTLQPVRIFAEGLVMPMSVLPYRDGAFVAQGPEIFFLNDTDKDGKADERKVLLSGFGVQDTHTLPHQLFRSPGGRITFSQGVLNAGTVTDASGKTHTFDKTLIASMTPEGTDLRILGAGMNNIWAWAQNRVGQVFIHEANDFGFGLAEFVEDSSYPSFRITKMHPDTPLHPPTAQGLGLGGTGFSGIAICDDRAGSFPASWKNRLCVANPITGKINSASGEQGSDEVWKFKKEIDLVSCEDPMFRPVAVSFGPDGCLYIVDWYNRIISHNEVARDHKARDKTRGRIWRVRHRAQLPAVVIDYTNLPTDKLPAALNANSTWAMRAAWHQLGERKDPSVVPALTALLRKAETPIDTRIHALWALAELGHFDAKLWTELLTQPDPHLRREAVRAMQAVPLAQGAPLLKLLADETSWSVRYEVLRYFRRAEGSIPTAHRAWLHSWRDPDAPTTKAGKYLALDGSYQQAFQDFLLNLAERKIQLPVFTKSKWDKVIETNNDVKDPTQVAERIAAIKSALPHADTTVGANMTKAYCLSCHSIAGEGIGFAPPLDGSANRDLEGLLTAIVDPNAAIEHAFRTFRIETNDGASYEGFNQTEDNKGITLLMMGGAQQDVPIPSIRQAGYIDGKSVMLDITAGMTAEQVAEIVAYLRTVK